MIRGPYSLALVAFLALISACDQKAPEKSGAGSPAAPTAATSPATLPPGSGSAQADFPEPDITKLLMPLQMRIGAARQAARSDPNDVHKVIDLGALYFAQGFAAEAVPVIERATRLKPDDYGVWYFYGRVLEHAGKPEPALAAYLKAVDVDFARLQSDPNSPREVYVPAYIRAAALLLDKDAERAERLLQQAHEVDRTNPQVLGGLGAAAARAGRADQAIERLKAAITIAPRYFFAHSELARIYEERGQADLVRIHRDQAGGEVPYFPLGDPVESALLARGMHVGTLIENATQAVERREYTIAEEALQAAINADAGGVVARTALGDLRVLQQRYEDAVREYRSVLRVNPRAVDQRISLAGCLASLGKSSEAAEILRGVVSDDPSNAVALLQLCRVLVEQKKADEAVQMIEAAAAAASKNALALTQIGEVAVRIDRVELGEKYVRQSMALDPRLPQGRYMLGVILRRAGDVEGAEREWREALRIEPLYLPPRMGLLEILQQRRDRRAMEDVLREGLARAPYSPDMLNTLAWILATSPDEKQRNGQEAVAIAEMANRLTEFGNHALLDTLAAAYAEAGRFEEAVSRSTAAIVLARDVQRLEAARAYGERRELYARRQPYREP